MDGALKRAGSFVKITSSPLTSHHITSCYLIRIHIAISHLFIQDDTKILSKMKIWPNYCQDDPSRMPANPPGWTKTSDHHPTYTHHGNKMASRSKTFHIYHKDQPSKMLSNLLHWTTTLQHHPTLVQHGTKTTSKNRDFSGSCFKYTMLYCSKRDPIP